MEEALLQCLIVYMEVYSTTKNYNACIERSRCNILIICNITYVLGVRAAIF